MRGSRRTQALKVNLLVYHGGHLSCTVLYTEQRCQHETDNYPGRRDLVSTSWTADNSLGTVRQQSVRG